MPPSKQGRRWQTEEGEGRAREKQTTHTACLNRPGKPCCSIGNAMAQPALSDALAMGDWLAGLRGLKVCDSLAGLTLVEALSAGDPLGAGEALPEGSVLGLPARPHSATLPAQPPHHTLQFPAKRPQQCGSGSPELPIKKGRAEGRADTH